MLAVTIAPVIIAIDVVVRKGVRRISRRHYANVSIVRRIEATPSLYAVDSTSRPTLESHYEYQASFLY